MINLYRDLASSDNNGSIVLCTFHAHMAKDDVYCLQPNVKQACELCSDYAEMFEDQAYDLGLLGSLENDETDQTYTSI